MAKGKHSDPYRTLLRVLIALLILTVLFGTAFVLADKYQKGQRDVQAQQIDQQNQALADAHAKEVAAYHQAGLALQQQPDAPQRLTPAASGWDVLDLSAFPVDGAQEVTVTREEMLMGGLLLLNRFGHPLPADFPEAQLRSIMQETKFRVPTANTEVKLFPAAVAALDQFIAAAKAQGLEYYIVREGYRDMAVQTEKYEKEAKLYEGKLTGDALKNKVQQAVSYPGESDYQSGFSFWMDVYNKNDLALNSTGFQKTAQGKFLNENGWKYGIVFRFPVSGYPDAETADKSYVTGLNLKINAYRYVGAAHAAVMKTKGFVLEEYIDYLVDHPHIAVYEDGTLKYEIFRQSGGNSPAATVYIPAGSASYSISTDNMDGVITAVSY